MLTFFFKKKSTNKEFITGLRDNVCLIHWGVFDFEKGLKRRLGDSKKWEKLSNSAKHPRHGGAIVGCWGGAVPLRAQSLVVLASFQHEPGPHNKMLLKTLVKNVSTFLSGA